jgi:glycerol kinase
MRKTILALDQGTTSCRAILFDYQGNIIGSASREFRQIYPQPGWVEHDPEEVWQCQVEVICKVLKDHSISAEEVAAIGITNQRETVVVWDKVTGKPIGNAIVWQCRRTAPICEDLKARDLEETFRRKTGLVVDAYFSGTKIKWILDKYPGIREKAQRGEVLAGTMDTWLIWNLTGGASHVTDYSNASRTMIYNIHDLCWDEELLKILDIPYAMLPAVKPSSGYLGTTRADLFGMAIPITGAAGDQQSALFGQACFRIGEAKNTYGTGCFLLMNTGDKKILSSHNLLTTIAWGMDEKIEYALEGSIFVAGAAVQWLRDEMGLIRTAAESTGYARSFYGSRFCGVGSTLLGHVCQRLHVWSHQRRKQEACGAGCSGVHCLSNPGYSVSYGRGLGNKTCIPEGGRRCVGKSISHAVPVGYSGCQCGTTGKFGDNSSGSGFSGWVGSWSLAG